MNPNRQKLISALRAPLPPNFTWNFHVIHIPTDCGTMGCALGLAQTIFPETNSVNFEEAEFFGLKYHAADGIFFDPEFYDQRTHADVTPAMVADALEEAEEVEYPTNADDNEDETSEYEDDDWRS